MKFKYIFYLLLIIAIGSCKPELDEFTASEGSANFSHFISIGNSLTAGYSDGALYKSAQEYSFPNILATQFKDVGGGDFKQPYLDFPYGVGIQVWDSLIHGPPKPPSGVLYLSRLVLQPVNVCGDPTNVAVEPFPLDINYVMQNQPQFATALMTSIAAQGPFNNIGVPGLRSFNMLIPGFGMMNPYYGRFASDPAAGTMITDINLINPTFYTLWLGSNDVLGYALSGGDEGGDFITPMTPFQLPTGENLPGFAQSMDQIIGALNQFGAKGVIFNIPDILVAPIFHTIPWNGLVLTDQAVVDALNANYAPTGITFQLGQNAFVVADPTVPVFGMRQMVEGELIIGSFVNPIRCMNYGSQIPIPGKYYLNLAEIANIDGAVLAYNNKINDLETIFAGQIAKVDAHQLVEQVSTMGITLQGINFTTETATGNVFGLDGVHFCPRGAALVAHYAIDAINNSFGANIPQVNLVDYPSVPLP